jgi:hypothetical protein
MYAYRLKFTGEGVFLYKKKDGGIDRRVWASLVQRPISDRTIRRQTGPVRRSRRTGVLNWFSAGRRICPAGRRTPGELSGVAGLTAGAFGTGLGATRLTVDSASQPSSNDQIPTHL